MPAIRTITVQVGSLKTIINPMSSTQGRPLKAKPFSMIRSFVFADFLTLGNGFCGIGRLARFNATADALSDESGKVRYFEGTPIPTSVLIVALMGWLHFQDRLGEHIWLGEWSIAGWVLHPLALIYAISGSAMISTW